MEIKKRSHVLKSKLDSFLSSKNQFQNKILRKRTTENKTTFEGSNDSDSSDEANFLYLGDKNKNWTLKKTNIISNVKELSLSKNLPSVINKKSFLYKPKRTIDLTLMNSSKKEKKEFMHSNIATKPMIVNFNEKIKLNLCRKMLNRTTLKNQNLRSFKTRICDPSHRENKITDFTVHVLSNLKYNKQDHRKKYISSIQKIIIDNIIKTKYKA